MKSNSSIIGADIFFCVFAMIIVTKEIVPRHEGADAEKLLLIEWPKGRNDFCFLDVFVEDADGTTHLTKDLEIRAGQSDSSCVYSTLIDNLVPGPRGVVVEAVLPYIDVDSSLSCPEVIVRLASACASDQLCSSDTVRAEFDDLESGGGC